MQGALSQKYRRDSLDGEIVGHKIGVDGGDVLHGSDIYAQVRNESHRYLNACAARSYRNGYFGI